MCPAHYPSQQNEEENTYPSLLLSSTDLAQYIFKATAPSSLSLSLPHHIDGLVLPSTQALPKSQLGLLPLYYLSQPELGMSSSKISCYSTHFNALVLSLPSSFPTWAYLHDEFGIPLM